MNGRSTKARRHTGIRKVRRRTNSGMRMLITLMLTCVFVSALMGELHTLHLRALLEAQPLETIHAHEGDTMWLLAQDRSVEGVSTRELVYWLCEHNNISSACLMPGQAIEVPARA